MFVVIYAQIDNMVQKHAELKTNIRFYYLYFEFKLFRGCKTQFTKISMYFDNVTSRMLTESVNIGT